MDNKRQRIEIADIFRSHANVFLSKHKLCPVQQKAIDDIMQCRTASLGGNIKICDNCGHIGQSYNSCRNRHCPKCQFINKAKWVDKVSANLPPVKQFHLVYTIPACLHKLFYINQAKSYDLLFKAAGKTLLKCAANPDFFGAQAGAVAILHTWGQTMVYHPHIHMIVPAGGLSEDQTEWVRAKNKFLLPVKALSAVFRGILCRSLEKAVSAGEIVLPEGFSDFQQIKDQCYRKKWVVFSEKPFSNSDSLIQYLGSYIHRVAISNHRILEHKDGKVRFYYKDNKSAGLKRCITLEADEFISRFLMHILPSGFYKIRYFGFMAMCQAKRKLAICLDLIGISSFLPVLEGLAALDVWRMITGRDPLKCPVCGTGGMRPQLLPVVNSLKSG